MQVYFFGKLALTECLSPLSLQNWKSSKCKEIPFRSHLSDKGYLNSIKTLLSARLLLSKPPDQSFAHLLTSQCRANVESKPFFWISNSFILNLMVKSDIILDTYIQEVVKGIEIFPANLRQRKGKGERSGRNV